MYPGVHAARTPDRVAVVLDETGETVTYGELEDRSSRLARYLHGRGLRRGDGLVLLTDNDVHTFEVYWAAMRSGLYLTVVNHHLTPGEVAYIVNDCGASVLVASGGTRELAEAVVPLTPAIGERLSYSGAVDGHRPLDEVLADVPAGPLEDQPRGADMLYSSGTTGRPKGIRSVLPDRQVDEPGDAIIASFGALYDFGPDTVYLSPAPIYHAAPLRFCGMTQALGGTVVLLRRFDPEEALAAIERHRVTHSQWVPTMFVRFLKLPAEVRARYDVSSLRVAVHAAAPCPIEVKRAMIEWWGPVLEEYYAATESNGATLIGSADWLAHPGSVGRAASGTLHICADDGGEQEPGTVGTIFFEQTRAPFEYHNDPEKTRASQHPHHATWTTTGDLGYVDDQGYLYLTDRKAFMIISGGVNIYPQEIENVLTPHPKVLDVAVIGVPDPDMGEVVRAVVIPAPGASPGPDLEAELLAFAGEHLARFKLPRAMDFVESLPRTPTGKLVKGKLRERYAVAPTPAT